MVLLVSLPSVQLKNGSTKVSNGQWADLLFKLDVELSTSFSLKAESPQRQIKRVKEKEQTNPLGNSYHFRSKPPIPSPSLENPIRNLITSTGLLRPLNS
jgi:hypothetical protein